MFIAGLAILEALYAYPVAGTQRSFAGAALIAVAAICLADGARLVSRGLAEAGTALAPPLRTGARTALVAICVYVAALAPLPNERLVYQREPALPFPGAQRVHVPPEDLARLEWLVPRLQRCSTFVTFPGMSSLYLFSAKRPPEYLPQVWMRLLDERRQAEIVRRIEGDPNACAVVSDELVRFWSSEGPYPRRALLRFIEDDFQVAAERKSERVLRRG
jgi:hypothetical protein